MKTPLGKMESTFKQNFLNKILILIYECKLNFSFSILLSSCTHVFNNVFAIPFDTK